MILFSEHECGLRKCVSLDEKGFGIIEVMIAAAVGAVVMLSMSSMMTSVNHSIRGSRTLASRDQLLTRIGREAGNSDALKASLLFSTSAGFPGNAGGGTPTMFEKCVNGSPPNGCVAKDASNNPQSYGFTLTDSFSNPLAGPKDTTTSDANAAVYDLTGAPCPNRSLQAPNANCQILVTTAFTPKCSNGAATCAQASSITVTLTISQAPGITPPPGMGLLTLKDQSQSVTTGVPFPGTTLGAANYLAKWTSNTQLGVSSIFEDNVTGKLGIGTSTPATKLDIQETRNDTSGGNAYTLNLTQMVSPPVDNVPGSGPWFIPMFVNARSGGTNTNLRGINSILGQVNWNESSASPQSAYGVEGNVKNQSTATMLYTLGVSGSSVNTGSGTMNSAIGVQGQVVNFQNPGSINSANAGYFQVVNSGTGAINAAIGGFFQIGNSASTGPINTGYGVNIGNILATNKWSLYASDATAPSFFAGNVGIGTSSPSYNLHVVGTAGLSTGTAWTNASDIRLKDIRGDYDKGLAEILKLHTVKYNYKKNNALGLPSDFEKVGFIAQEVREVIPEAVSTRKDGYLELNVDPIHWAAINAIQELYRKIVTHGDQIQKLEQENAVMKVYLCSKDPAAPFCK
ncbi:MAG: tail fiber domain-containing protein [Bdellovibrionia bacterium]